MLELSAALVLVLVLCTSAVAADRLPNGGKPFIACETYSIRDYIGSGKITLQQVPALLKGLGIKGVVWNDMFFKSWDKPYLDTLKKAAADSGIITAGLIIEGNLASDDENARRRQIEEDKMKLEAAAYLGCPVVRINIGGTGSDEKDATVGVQRVIDAFKQILPLAKRLNIKVTIENHGGVSKKADWILAVIKGTDPKWIGSCLDFGNWPSDVRYSETQKLAPYAYHVHAKTHNFGPDGEETEVDYGRVLGMMKEAGYRGAVSIEFEGPGDQIEGVKKTRDLILKHWPELR